MRTDVSVYEVHRMLPNAVRVMNESPITQCILPDEMFIYQTHPPATAEAPPLPTLALSYIVICIPGVDADAPLFPAISSR